MKNKGGNLFSSAYKTSATIGRLIALLSLIIGLVIGIIMIIVGIVLLVKKGKYTEKTTAIIKSSSCQGIQCSTVVEFTVQDKIVEATVSTIKPYNRGESMSILYNKNNYKDVAIKTNSKKFAGWLLMIIGFILILGVSVYYYIVQKFKVVAAVTGVGNMINFIK
jgi:hypothetical protein